MAQRIVNGEPGTTYTNDTGKVLYQFVVSWHNSCGQCIAMDHTVGPSFPIPMHRGCRCRQVLLPPGGTSRPFVDFAEKVKELDEGQRTRVVGRSNLTLIERGIVGWDDVVTRTRVRDFREVVASKRLDIPSLVRGGVPERLARQAYESVHAPAHEIAAKARQDLLDKVLAKGVEKDQLRRALAERLAARVGIGEGPSGPGALPVRPTTPKPRPGGVTSRRISASPESGERLYSPQRQYLASLGVKPEAIEAVAPRPAVASAAPILPGRPIAERIAGWKEGHEKLARLREIASSVTAADEHLAAQRARLDEMVSAYKRAKGPAKAAAKLAMEARQSEVFRANDALYLARREAHAAAQSILATGREFKLGVDREAAASLTSSQANSAAGALQWMRKVVAPPSGAESEPMRINMRPIPAIAEQRSFCQPGAMVLEGGVAPATVVHETGHHLDYHMPGVDESARAFLKHRVGDETPRPLSEVTRGDYGADEMGRKDKFHHAFGDDDAWYVGKEYPTGNTEITSMGLEMMYRDPVAFARKDPEYALWTLGIMHGPLR